jgi:GT2 family glycosyltransferase
MIKPATKIERATPDNQAGKRPVITAIMLNYRDARRTLTCINSVLAEAVDHVMVWDNSADMGISAAAVRAGNPDPERVMIEISQKNIGFAAGVNRAIELAWRRHPGTWVLLINNDAVLLPGALPLLRQALLENTQAKLAAPRINHAGRVLGAVYYQRLTGMLFLHKTRPGCFPYPSGCCFLVASERFHFPLFDERFFMYGEDCALGFRLHAPGDILYLKEVLVYHELSASSQNGSQFYEERMVASHFLMAKVLAKSKLQFSVYMIARLITLLARSIIRACRYRSTAPLRALWHGALIALEKPS